MATREQLELPATGLLRPTIAAPPAVSPRPEGPPPTSVAELMSTWSAPDEAPIRAQSTRQLQSTRTLSRQPSRSSDMIGRMIGADKWIEAVQTLVSCEQFDKIKPENQKINQSSAEELAAFDTTDVNLSRMFALYDEDADGQARAAAAVRFERCMCGTHAPRLNTRGCRLQLLPVLTGQCIRYSTRVLGHGTRSLPCVLARRTATLLNTRQ